MNGFKTASLTQQALDPYKRVKYSFGLVLGEDEFKQDQLYLMERDQLHNRGLHGYGTICGLQVSLRDGTSGPEVVVSPGIAVNPKGQTIRLPETQCARLNEWLTRYQTTIAESFTPPDTLTLYVRLCYRECETDSVPVPGGPCRSQEDSVAASRIADNFELSLTLDAPEQVAEDVVRRFGNLLNRIEISSQPGTFLTEEEMINLVRDLPTEVEAPPDIDEPPEEEMESRWRLHPDEACHILHSAFRVWVTEVRPALLPDGSGCAAGAPNEGCILLAELRVPVDDAWQVNNESEIGIEIDEGRRPVLLHTRLLQEWLLCGGTQRVDNQAVRPFATLFTQNTTTIRAWIHHPILLDIPPEGITININDVPSEGFTITPLSSTNVFDLGLSDSLSDGDRITVRFDSQDISEASSQPQSLQLALEELDYAYLGRQAEAIEVYLTADLPALNDLTDVSAPEPSHGQALIYRDNQWVPSDHGRIAGLADDDHPQYLLADGTRPLTGDQSAGNNRITNLAQATNNGDALPFGQAAGGDLSGTYPDPTVSGLQGQSVAPTRPNNGQVLTWNQAQQQWEPQTPQTGGASALDELSDVNAPSPANNQVLTWNQQQQQWEPRTSQAAGGEFVQARFGPYAIVAAGFFNIDPDADIEDQLRPQGPVYGDLSVIPDPDRDRFGDYLLQFPAYQDPNQNRIMYIVKGTVQDERDPRRERATFEFVRFRNNGIEVRVLSVENEPIETGFMVEISQFTEVGAGGPA